MVQVILAFLICSIATAKTIYVSPTGDGTTGDSWQNAFQSLNTAYNGSSEGDSIYVESGIYNESLLINRVQVKLIGGLAGNKDLVRGNTRNNEDDRSTLDAKGSFWIILNFFQDGYVDGFNLINSTARGSFIHSRNVVFNNCNIINNSVGGGIVIESSTVEFNNCNISNNKCDREAGAISIGFESSVLIDSCNIENNEGVYCGGIGVGATKPLIIVNSIIRGNRTTGGDIEGGGVQIHGSTVEISNSLIYGNSTLYAPGAQISIQIGGLCHLTSSTVIGSVDDIYTNIEGDNPFFIDNSILWGAPGILKAGAEVLYSCIQGGYTDTGNISDDPKFRDATNGDYRLLPDSPCIDTAGTSGPSDDLNGNPRPVDIAGIGREVTDTYDMGAYEVQLNEVPTPTPTQIPSQIDPGNTMMYK